MNKRTLITTIGLTLLGVATRGTDTGYRVQVTNVDRTNGYVEARFIVVPQDLRIVCRGEVKKIDVDDYVKVDARDGTFMIGNATCNQIRWLR